MPRKHRSGSPGIIGHGDFSPPEPFYRRESGALALAREDGSELRLHSRPDGQLEAIDWRLGGTREGGQRWIGASRGFMGAVEWERCGVAAGTINRTTEAA